VRHDVPIHPHDRVAGGHGHFCGGVRHPLDLNAMDAGGWLVIASRRDEKDAERDNESQK
jgi:hypothetical protein